jgi:cytochrome P450
MTNDPRPPGPKGHPLIGHLIELRRDQLGFLRACGREFGDVVEVRYGPRPVLLLNHPRDIEEVLVTQHRRFAKGRFYALLRPLLGQGLLTSEGSFWLRQRRLAQPAFHRERVAGYAAVMAAYAEEAVEAWADGAVIDVQREMSALTLRVVCRALFDADVTGEAAVVGGALPIALRELDAQLNGPEFLLPGWIWTPSRLRLRRAVRHLDRVVYRIIARRRADGADRGDLLSALLAVRDEDGTGMTDRQLRDETITVMLAGHETTALALSWALHLLGGDPAVEARLHAEVSEVLGDRPATAADLPRLRYADAVVSESMRLYPPIPVIGREATEPCTVAGRRLPAGANVAFSPWVLHRDRRFFPEPESFRPERWLEGLAERLPRCAYFPFATGPRVCIGQGFARMEAVLLLATIVRRCQLAALDDRPVVAEPALTLRLRDGLPMRVQRRAGRPGRAGPDAAAVAGAPAHAV